MAAKAPVGERTPIDVNHIKNSLFDADAAQPGAGGRVEDWAGFAARVASSEYPDINTFPIVYSTVGIPPSAIKVRAYVEGSFFFRITLQNAAYPGTTYSITKDIYMSNTGGGTSFQNYYATITPAEMGDLIGRDGNGNPLQTTVTFQSCIFTLMTPGATTGAPATPKPGISNKCHLEEIRFRYQDSSGGGYDGSVVEGYEVYGGARLTEFSGAAAVTLFVPDDSEYGHPNTKAISNGPGNSWANNSMPQDWKHYCGLFCHAQAGQNYDTFFGKKFFRARKTRNEFKEIASLYPPSEAVTDNPSGKYQLGPNQARGIEIFGSGGLMTERDDDGTNPKQTSASRNWPTIASVGLATATPMSGSIATWGSRATRGGDIWVKHSVFQTIKIPNNAVRLKYGAHVQCPQDVPYSAYPADHDFTVPPPGGGPGGPSGHTTFYKKAFRDYNFGGIQISQDYGDNGTAEPSDSIGARRFVRGDAIYIAPGSGPTSAPGVNDHTLARVVPDVQALLPPLNGSHDMGGDSGLKVKYNWNGLSTLYGNTPVNDNALNNSSHQWPAGFRWPTNIVYTSERQEAHEFGKFKLVEREWASKGNGNDYSGWFSSSSDLTESGGFLGIHTEQIKYLQLELIFWENGENLDQVQPSTSDTGRIRFYAPFVKFFDANDNLISS